MLLVLLLASGATMVSGQAAPQGGAAGTAGTPLENTLVIRETPENLIKIEQLLKSLDLPPKQVLIEAHIFDVVLDDSNATGIDWQALMTQLVRQDPLWSFSQAFPQPAAADSFSSLRFGTLSNEHFSLLLKGFAKNKRAKSLSNPKVVAVNGQTANITIKQEIPYFKPQQTQSNVTTTTIQEPVFKVLPITLEVTPSIDDDGTIRMHVKPTITSLVSMVNGVPWTEERSANTNVLLRSGETLILGGLITENRSTDQNSVPVLGKIPLLKKVFTQNSKTSKRSELVVFITPNIVVGERKKGLTSFAPSSTNL